MGALDLLGGWDVPFAAAGVVAAGGRGEVAVGGDRTRPVRWASVTKLASALAVLIAVEEETLALDDAAGPEGSTVRHLLAHASGFAYDEDRLLAQPGKRRIYSNQGFEVLAATLSERAGMPFERYLADGVLTPLGIKRTEMHGTAAAGLVGPLDDLLKLAAELLSPTLISQETLDGAVEVAFAGLPGVLPGWGKYDPLDWGLGFEIRDDKSPHWTGHRNSPATFGHFGGSGSFLWVDPVAGLACASLSGREFDTWAKTAWPAFSDAVLEEFASPPAA